MNKFKMLLMQHAFLNKYVMPKHDFPFFSSMDMHMMTLSVDITDNSEKWDGVTITAVCELVKLMSAYFYSRVTACENEGIPVSQYEVERKALDICLNKLNEQCLDSEVHINALFYGFIHLDDEYKAVLQVREEFAAFAKLMRDYLAEPGDD